jgi:hypothetical protein
MEVAFKQSEGIHPFYKIEKSLESYRTDCSLWQADGTARDTKFALWQETFLEKRNSFWWLFLGSAVFIGSISILILWLFRQLERDEREITRLGERLVEDESEIFRQQKIAQQWRLEHDQKNEHSLEK